LRTSALSILRGENLVMAKRLIALEWDAREARAVLVSSRGDQPVVEDALALPWPPGENGAAPSPTVLGQILGAALAGRRFPKGDMLLSVGRAMVELKQFSLPPAPEDELPEMVRFQALREFNTLADNTALDYVPLPTQPGQPQPVLAAALSPEALQQLTATCTAAGFKPTQISLRPFATTSLLSRQSTSGNPRLRLLVDVLSDEVDLTVLAGKQVIFVRTARLHGDEVIASAEAAKPLLGEIRRTLAAIHTQLGDERIEAISLCGARETHAPLAERIGLALQIRTELFDPWEGIARTGAASGQLPRDPGRYAALLGMVSDELQGLPPSIDFLHPRKRRPPPDRRRPLAFGLATAVAAVFAIVWVTWSQLAALDTQIQDLRDELNRQTKLLADDRLVEPAMHVAEIEKWKQQQVNWLAELERLSKDLPEAQKLMLTQAIFTARKQGGEIMLEGLTTQGDVAASLPTKLRDDRHQVTIRDGQEDNKSRRYGWRFKSTVSIAREPDEDEAPAPARPAATASAPTASAGLARPATKTPAVPAVPTSSKKGT